MAVDSVSIILPVALVASVFSAASAVMAFFFALGI
jgi:hypothetical protein